MRHRDCNASRVDPTPDTSRSTADDSGDFSEFFIGPARRAAGHRDAGGSGRRAKSCGQRPAGWPLAGGPTALAAQLGESFADGCGRWKRVVTDKGEDRWHRPDRGFVPTGFPVHNRPSIDTKAAQKDQFAPFPVLPKSSGQRRVGEPLRSSTGLLVPRLESPESCRSLNSGADQITHVSGSQAQNVLGYDNDLLLYWSIMVSDPSLGRGRLVSASTTFSSTNTRTLIVCRRRFFRCAPGRATASAMKPSSSWLQKIATG